MKTIKTLTVLTMAGMLTIACKNEKKDDIHLEDHSTEMATETAETSETMANETAMRAKIDEEAKMARENSISGLASSNAELSTLSASLKTAELDSMLMKPGTYTVFAPSNHAFEKLPEKTREKLMLPENKSELTNLLQYHVVAGVITSDKLDSAIKSNGGKYSFKTVQGEELTAMNDGDQIVIKDAKGNKAQVIKGNVEASNGIVYIIDDVLMSKR